MKENVNMPQLTPDQKHAVVCRKSNILISAAAGSGKTRVLIERIASLIKDDKVPVDSLLVVTFTNAAAGEMRERLLAKLREELLQGDDSFIRKQILNIQKASISTIHAYCIELIRRHFHIVELDPNFKIADDTEMQLLKEELLEQLMENYYEKGDGYFYDLIEMYSGNKTDEGLRQLILELYHFAQSKPSPFDWLREIVSFYNLSRNDFDESEMMDTFKNNFKIDFQGLYELSKLALDKCMEYDLIEYMDCAKNEYAQIKDINEMIESAQIGSVFDAMNDIQFKRLSSIKKDRKELVGEYAEVYKSIRNDLKKNIKKIIEIYAIYDFDKEVGKMNELYPRLEYLIDLVEDFSRTFDEAKRDQGVLDFNDIEHYAIKILSNDDLAVKERKRYSFIFLDEYQDTNEVQESIISRIKREDNLFQVGDVKQSIYRFRLADPEIFIKKRKLYLDSGEENEVIQLNQNFRSRPSILMGINELFSAIMSDKLGDVQYDEKEYLNPGAKFEDLENENIKIELIYGEKDIDDEILKEYNKIEKEAIYIAKRIKELIGTPTYDAKNGEFRKIEYRDIVILMRAVRRSSNIFNEIFMKEDIPIYVDDAEGYLDSVEVSLIINLLKLIDNRNQDIALISVLRSPICAFRTEELIQIRIEDQEVSYYEATLRYIENHEDDIADRLRSFYEKLTSWEKLSKLIKLGDLMWEILTETNFYYYVAAMPGGEQRQANIRLLIDRANAYEKVSFGGLFDFIRYTKKLRNQSQDLSAAKLIGENENVVRMMSIHKSKGLEFPIVICACMGKQFNQQDLRKKVILHKELGLGTQYIDPKLRSYNSMFLQEVVKQQIKIENLSEEMRILYVAMTRAVDQLIMTGYVNDMNKKIENWSNAPSIYRLKQDKSYIDWIMRFALTTESVQDLQKQGFDAKYNTSKAHYSIKLIAEIELLKDKKEMIAENIENLKTMLDSQAEKTEMDDSIEETLNWSYPAFYLSNLKRKYSVSELNAYKKEPWLRDETKYDKKILDVESKNWQKRGVLLHLILQNIIDYSFEDSTKLRAYINNYDGANEFLSEKDYSYIEKYLKSDLFARIKKSDKVYREQPFVLKKSATILESEYESGEILIQGIIDLLFEENGEIVLVDYKSGGSSYSDEALVKAKYEKQINLYKEAVESILNKSVKEKYLYLIESGKILKM
jgi:ATP-dependent helicase/nuclease subunit A